MQIARTLCLVGLLFGLVSTAQAQSFQLLGPDVGWTGGYGDRILWTNDGGRDWEDITPPEAKDGLVTGVFFLDTRRGWMLLRHGELDVPGAQFDLAYTEDAGHSWSMKRVKLPAEKKLTESILSAAGLTFADPLHGWLSMRVGLSAAFQGTGVLLATSDGGETWNLATTSHEYDVIGPMVLLTPQWGWLVGAGGNEPLLVTHDGGKTFKSVNLEPPMKTDQMREYDRRFEDFWRGYQPAFDRYQRAMEKIAPETAAKIAAKRPQHPSYAAYDLPIFKDRSHGYVCVTYPGLVVLFHTDDGGVTWKPDRVLSGLDKPESGATVASTVTDSTWITGRASKDQVPHLRKLDPGSGTTTNEAPGPEDFSLQEISFATPKQGWVRTIYGKLLATTDGGATWTEITPPRKLRSTFR